MSSFRTVRPCPQNIGEEEIFFVRFSRLMARLRLFRSWKEWPELYTGDAHSAPWRSHCAIEAGVRPPPSAAYGASVYCVLPLYVLLRLHSISIHTVTIIFILLMIFMFGSTVYEGTTAFDRTRDVQSIGEDAVHATFHGTQCHIRWGDTRNAEMGRGATWVEGVSLLPSGLADSWAGLLWAGGHTVGNGEQERKITIRHICQSLTERREGEWETKGGTNSSTQMELMLNDVLPSLTSTATVVIDGYTHNSTLTSGDSVPLGTQIILVCRVVGFPHGAPLNYNWTCPNGPCEVEGNYNRKVYNEHILAINTTSVSDGGIYTCRVTATGGQEATGCFTLNITGMCVCVLVQQLRHWCFTGPSHTFRWSCCPQLWETHTSSVSYYWSTTDIMSSRSKLLQNQLRSQYKRR